MAMEATRSGVEAKPFMVEMRAEAMRLHSQDQSREGKVQAQEPPIDTWNPTVEAYIRHLVDSKLVFDTLEAVVNCVSLPWYAELRNTGLERSAALKKDLEWFRQQGHAIPEPSAPGITFASYLEELSENAPPAFVCHFYNAYFGHAAGGRNIGKMVAEKILNNKEMEFYRWEGVDVSQLLQHVRGKLNQVTAYWSREEKDRCLQEIEKSFVYSRTIRSCLI
ncbi:hypothetical protein QOZ80_1AG0020470 [Eleusine coracana subsp. coracana]|nr:hypothetical protein QOZ80_1AG0020470 [Eleusine coracana subsp. coracana]